MELTFQRVGLFIQLIEFCIGILSAKISNFVALYLPPERTSSLTSTQFSGGLWGIRLDLQGQSTTEIDLFGIITTT